MSTPPKLIKRSKPIPPGGHNVPTSRGPITVTPSGRSNRVPERGGHRPQVSNQGGSFAVKGMQQAILDFANAISSIDLNSIKTQPKQEDSFGNFLSEQYLGSTEPGMLDSLAKQMKMIGTPGQHDKADGIWGRNTNQALKNILLVSRGMFSLSKDLQYPLVGYDENQLNDLEKLIPAEYTQLKDANDKEVRSKEISTHIKALEGLFRGFKNGVSKNPQLKSFLEKKKPFLTMPESSKSAHQILNEEDKKTYEQYKSVALQPSNVTLGDLRDMISFKLYMKNNKMNPESPEEITKALGDIFSKLSVG